MSSRPVNGVPTSSGDDRRTVRALVSAVGWAKKGRWTSTLVLPLVLAALVAAPNAHALSGTAHYTAAESNIAGKYWVSATASDGDASLAIDGRTDTVWVGANPGPATATDPATLTVDLGGAYDAVHKVETIFASNSTVYKYRLQGSTGGDNWSDLVNRSGNTQQGGIFTDVFAFKGLRYLRLVIVAGEPPGVRELNIFNYLRPDLDNGSDSSEQGGNTNAYRYNAANNPPAPGIRGGRFSDAGSIESGNNFFGLTSDLGWDTTRLRVWNEPKNEATGTASTGAGNCSPENTRRVARAIVGAGQNLAIDLHYADSWADPHNQPKPYAWASLPFDDLVSTTYDWTYDFVRSLVEQGTTPSIVALGNEIARGMMWGQEYDQISRDVDRHHYYQSGRHLGAPGGGVKWLLYEAAEGDTSSPAYREFLDSIENLARLVDAGNRAVRQVNADLGTQIDTQMHFAFNKFEQPAPGVRVALDPEEVFAKVMTLIEELSGHLEARGGMVDRIGVSYYADWHGSYDVFQRELVEISRALPGVTLNIAESSPKFSGTVTNASSDANRPVGFTYTVQSQGEDTVDLMKTINDLPNNVGTGVWVWNGTNVFGTGTGDNGTLRASFKAWNDGFAKNVVESHVYVVTKKGVAPQLPATVNSLDLQTGRTSDVSVAWEGIDPARYGSEGTFTVRGTADVTVSEVHRELVSIGQIGRGVAMRDVTATVEVVENRPPIAGPDSATLYRSESVDLDVLANDSDPDGDALAVVSFTQPAHGSVSQNQDGALRYAHDGSATTSDSFMYTVGDGFGGTDTATVTVTVTGGPDLRVSAITTSSKGDRTTVTATVENAGTTAAGASSTEFLLDGATVLGVVGTPAIAAGASAHVSVVWNTADVKGNHVIEVTADRGAAVAETNEGNNSSSLTVTVKGNKVTNDGFE